MKKTYGVCFGLLALGLALGSPASMRAAGSGSETSTTTEVAATPAASSPKDLDSRIDALEAELSELRTELAAKKEAEPVPAVVATPAVAAQDKPADKISVASLFGPTSVSGFVDGYYQVNFAHPNQISPNFYPGAGFR